MQNNSAGAEESDAASEELSDQASMLKMLIDEFKIESNYEQFQQQLVEYNVDAPNVIDDNGNKY